MLNDSHIVVAKENIKTVWRELLQFMRNAKESAANLTDPRLLGEHLQIIFRDESKCLPVCSSNLMMMAKIDLNTLQLLEIIYFSYASA